MSTCSKRKIVPLGSYVGVESLNFSYSALFGHWPKFFCRSLFLANIVEETFGRVAQLPLGASAAKINVCKFISQLQFIVV